MIFNSDHPSRCGENRLYLTSESTRSGSPPRTRGKPCVLRHTHLFNGITPAGAGKTKPLSANAVTGYGSPPQVRGKLGKTAEIRHRRQDHPRRCGENASVFFRAASSIRITPAGAGKTDWRDFLTMQTKDHPRRCGENRQVPPRSCGSRGSPPQVRGKPFFPCGLLTFFRITPAGAGKTTTAAPAKVMYWDHPRRCGENCPALPQALQLRGSPPQVRGKPGLRPPPPALVRITPAGAGKTGRRCWRH